MPALGQLRNDSFMSPFDIIKDRDRVRKSVFYGRVAPFLQIRKLKLSSKMHVILLKTAIRKSTKQMQIIMQLKEKSERCRLKSVIW